MGTNHYFLEEKVYRNDGVNRMSKWILVDIRTNSSYAIL